MRRSKPGAGERWKAGLIALALVLVVPGAARAATIDMAWNSCTGPLNLEPLPQLTGLWISTLGPVEAHRAYEFRIRVEGQGGYLPDAWRFDAGGCQDHKNISYAYAVPSSKTCPPFNDALPKSIQASFESVAFDPSNLGALIRFRVEYPSRAPDDPTLRRHLGKITFDHQFSIEGPTTNPLEYCGDFERGLCLSLLPEHCHYTKDDGPGTVIPFTVGSGVVTVRNFACAVVPAAPATWGQIKGAYRR